MNQFKFSVVIAAYNSDLWISKAIFLIIINKKYIKNKIKIFLIYYFIN